MGKEFKLKLKTNQKEMGKKCYSAEKETRINMLASPVGSGKTGALLYLIVKEKEFSKTLIVVPQNILNQWKHEIDKMTTGITTHIINDYQSISSLYTEDLPDCDLILTSSIYYNTILDLINKSYIKRIIFDEIDSMEELMKNLNFKEKQNTPENNTLFGEKMECNSVENAKIWYVSASLKNLKNIKGELFINGKKFDENEIISTVSDFDLEPEIYCELLCSSEIHPFTDFLSIDQLDALNSINFNNVLQAKSEKDIIIKLRKYYADNIINLEKHISDDKITIEIKKGKSRKEMLRIIDKNEKDILFYKKLESFISFDFPEVNKEDTKQVKLEKIILDEVKSGKILMFTDFQESYNKIRDFLDKNEIVYDDLQGGSADSISDSIKRYKSGDTRILLLDSNSNSRGLNLENTTSIIFIHRTKDYMKNQIIGRAQRPGRKSTLKVFTLLNENEILA